MAEGRERRGREREKEPEEGKTMPVNVNGKTKRLSPAERKKELEQ